jgi:SAM-dependent methyltransferase
MASIFEGVPLNSEVEVQRQVREFYDSVGWQEISVGVYQNARYEDLRPVSREYIHRCHMRVSRHLLSEGKYLLDAGSGPIQYPEYLEYSRGYHFRVCLDLSRRALRGARERVGEHGLFVIGDVARLPFRPGIFTGAVSLHTVHHLPANQQRSAFEELYRVLEPGGRTVVVSSWGKRSLMMRIFRGPIAVAFWLQRAYRRLLGIEHVSVVPVSGEGVETNELLQTPGTYTHQRGYSWVERELTFLPGLEVRVWRSVGSSFLRAFIHRRLLGLFGLRFLFWLEERAPRTFGRLGQHPMILFHRTVQELTNPEGVA